MQNTQTSNKVIIIGAGLGGLTLAQGLKKAGILFHVYERDPTADFRSQGYRIRIIPEGGEALKKNLSAEVFSLFERTCAEMIFGESLFNAVDGKVLEDEGILPKRQGIPELLEKAENIVGPFTVDRTTMRNVLLVGLEGNVTFGKEFEKYEESEKGVTVHFKDGSKEEAGLLVGADGARSRVRRQYLPESVVVDTDGRAIYGKTTITKELEERLPKETMRGITMLLDKRHEVPLMLFYEAIRFPKDVGTESNGKVPSVKDYIYWVLFSRKSTLGIEDEELWKLSKEDVKNLSLKFTEDWDPAFRSLLELQDQDQSAAIRVSSALPDLPFWTPSARVTLLGDAIHVMSPTGGVGANTALADAAVLCEVIAKGGITAESIGKYEEKMRKFAKRGIEKSYSRAKKLYGQPPFNECKRLEF